MVLGSQKLWCPFFLQIIGIFPLHNSSRYDISLYCALLCRGRRRGVVGNHRGLDTRADVRRGRKCQVGLSMSASPDGCHSHMSVACL
jgi:hypothetical protein